MQLIKSIIKEYIFRRLNIPLGKYGMPAPLMKYLKENEPVTLIDIGAHNGDFSDSVTRYCGIKKAILVEPLAHKIELLRERFPGPEYHIINNAVSDVRGTSSFEVNRAAETSSLLKIKRDLPELKDVDVRLMNMTECQTITLDDLFGMFDISSADLLKMDVQGAEHLVIRGGQNALRKTKRVWTEVSFKPLYESSSNFMDVYHALYELGFTLMEISRGFQGPDGELLQADALFVRGS